MHLLGELHPLPCNLLHDTIRSATFLQRPWQRHGTLPLHRAAGMLCQGTSRQLHSHLSIFPKAYCCSQEQTLPGPVSLGSVLTAAARQRNSKPALLPEKTIGCWPPSCKAACTLSSQQHKEVCYSSKQHLPNPVSSVSGAEVCGIRQMAN